MDHLFILLVMAAGAAVLAWNFVPSARERMRGWSTMWEAAFMAAFPVASEFVDAFKAEQVFWAGYLPDNVWKWVVPAMALWFMFKRVKTNTGWGDAK